MTATTTTGATVEWTDEMEANFLGSFIGETSFYRPVGTIKHFAMLIAYDRFSKTLPPNTKMDIESMWAKLETYYDLDALEQEAQPSFPNERKEFSLPNGWIQQHQQQQATQQGSKSGVKKYSSEEEDSVDSNLTPGQKGGDESGDSSSSNSTKRKKLIPTKKRVTRNQLK